MREIIRSALLLFNAFNVTAQLSTWRMNYGFAMGAQIDGLISLVLAVLLLFRGIWGPISWPFLRTAVARVIYLVIASALAGLAAVRVVYCLYMRDLLLNHWPRDDDSRTFATTTSSWNRSRGRFKRH